MELINSLKSLLRTLFGTRISFLLIYFITITFTKIKNKLNEDLLYVFLDLPLFLAGVTGSSCTVSRLVSFNKSVT